MVLTKCSLLKSFKNIYIYIFIWTTFFFYWDKGQIFRNKGQIFQPIAQAWHRNEARKSAFWFGSSTYLLHRYRCHIGTGFRYPTLTWPLIIYHCSEEKLFILTLLGKLDKLYSMWASSKEVEVLSKAGEDGYFEPLSCIWRLKILVG